MKTIQAIFEDGVFKPKEPIDLPAGAEVEIVLDTVSPEEEKALQEVYKILGERYNSGHHDTAERHNEHQP